MRILIADDEPLMLRKLDSLVGTAAPQAERCAFGDTAALKEFLDTDPPVDVAFLDINMGELNGVDVARTLQKNNPRINLIFCTGYSQYALDAVDLNCSGYLLKPVTLDAVRRELEHLRYAVAEQPPKALQVQCFGKFSAKAKGQELRFSYGKTREMLAYLIDRRGGMCSNAEIQAVLWDDDGQHGEYLKSLRKDLRHALAEHGCEEVLQSRHSGICIVPEKIACDYYDYLDGKPVPFCGEYMTGYEFAEETREILAAQQQ